MADGELASWREVNALRRRYDRDGGREHHRGQLGAARKAVEVVRGVVAVSCCPHRVEPDGRRIRFLVLGSWFFVLGAWCLGEWRMKNGE